MIYEGLHPLSAVITVPLELRFGMLEKFPIPPASAAPTGGVEDWLMKLQRALPDQRVHLHARVHPAQPGHSVDVLQLQGLRTSLISSVDLLAASVPNARRGLLDAVFRLERNGQQLHCSARVTPNDLRYLGRRALARLNLSAETAEATKNMSAFWSERLAWLKRSGIVTLEIRAGLQFLAWNGAA